MKVIKKQEEKIKKLEEEKNETNNKIKQLEEEKNEINNKIKQLEEEINDIKYPFKLFKESKIINNKDEEIMISNWIKPNSRIKFNLLFKYQEMMIIYQHFIIKLIINLLL